MHRSYESKNKEEYCVYPEIQRSSMSGPLKEMNSLNINKAQKYILSKIWLDSTSADDTFFLKKNKQVLLQLVKDWLLP